MSILTPDQRLRVFVSSTLRELVDERAAVKEGIQSLRLAPVMFEMGARPHPPRNLYRAYLEQSHIFVGIYWQSYGWIAPEMDVSGLEDEYLLSGDMPKLIYIREPAPSRDPMLDGLIGRIRDDSLASFRSFSTTDELRALVQDDLALLLTERFQEGSSGPGVHGTAPTNEIPAQPTRFIGRRREVDEVQELLADDTVRLLTLAGPGGIGKTRLAMEVARRIQDRFHDGVRFVPLAPVRDPARLPDHLVTTLGIKENTPDAIVSLEKWLHEKSLLLILDNFEQLIDASDVVAGFLEAAPRCTVLVTSRAVLRVRGEHEYFVPPMTLPEDVHGRMSDSDAVKLFCERAQEARPGLELGSREIETVSKICRKLDGLPLAIELAAARVKVMSPDQLLKRLTHRLDVLVGGARDLPARQQTLRATIDWSYQLLTAGEKTLFERFAAFRKGATLDAIEDICSTDCDIDVLEGVASLIEKSLLRQEVVETGEARFWMLETVREFAAEIFETSPDREAVKRRHAAFFENMCVEAHGGSTGSEQQLWITKVELDYPNIRLAANHLLERGEAATVATMAWNLILFTWVSGHMTDARAACAAILGVPGIDDLTRARALSAGGSAAFWQGDFGEAVPAFVEAKTLFEALGDRLGYAQTLLVLGMVSPELEGLEAAKEKLVEAISIFEDMHNEGWLALALTAYCWILMLMDEHEGMTVVFERAVEVARSLGAELTYGMSLGNLGQHRRRQGRLDESMSLQLAAIRPLIEAGHEAAISYTFLNTAETLIELRRLDDAARLVGLSEAILEELQVLPLTLMETRRARVAATLAQSMGAEEYEMANKEGRALTIDQGTEVIVANQPVAV